MIACYHLRVFPLDSFLFNKQKAFELTDTKLISKKNYVCITNNGNEAMILKVFIISGAHAFSKDRYNIISHPICFF